MLDILLKKSRVLVKMALHVNAVLESAHNHMKVTTKLQNNHSEPPEI